jgi:hypothetical protein
MTNREQHIGKLFTAGLQFRLASAVRLATTLNVQPLDLPVEWSHGQHVVGYDEVALCRDQADYAADFLLRSATYQMAVVIRNALKGFIPNPKASDDWNVRAAYQIARMIRNAFAHEPVSPVWSIDEDCRDTAFEIPGVIHLNTKGLNGTQFSWRHYGGPLAIFRLCQFVRTAILCDEVKSRQPVPPPTRLIYQQETGLWQRPRCIGSVLCRSTS